MTILDPVYKMKLKQLRKELKGHYKAVAKEAGTSKSSVSRVLWGEWVDENIIKKCIEVRDRVKMEKENMFKELSEKI